MYRGKNVSTILISIFYKKCKSDDVSNALHQNWVYQIALFTHFFTKDV